MFSGGFARHEEAAHPLGRAGYRPDIDGLRAVAVLMVVAFHLWLLPDGGAVGVAVFFVLSGYLITSILMAGPIRLRAFYGRRVRRLYPALAAMILLVLLIGRPPIESAGYALAYVGNAVPGELLGPFRHTWTLAIEEQFYVVWPVILALAGRSRWAWLAVAPVAFLPAYWPLALGCAVALSRVRLPDWTGLVGLAAILAVAFGPGVPLACAGTALIVASRAPLGRLAPLGRISYGIYLWHYPIIQAAFWLGLRGYPAAVLLSPFLSIGAGWLSYRYVEQPIRRARLLMPEPVARPQFA